jgi:thiamine biosynthesis protein ThiS
MQVRVNDQDLDLPEATTVTDLLGRLQLPGTRVAVEINGQIVRRVDHPSTPLRQGDRVEVVTLVGGG